MINNLFRSLARKFSNMSSLEAAKKTAAYKAVDEYVKDNFVVGVGSGSTVVYAAERLGQRAKEENLNLICIPTSFQSKQLIVKNGLRLGDLEINPEIDVCVDGADEVDSNLTLIKGGGGCLLQEKIVASCAKILVIIADYTKDSTMLGEKYKKGIPIEVVPMAYLPVKNRIEKYYKGELKLRMAVSKAGPVVTDNGNFILDWINFDSTINWEEVDKAIHLIPGVVETGLFVKMAKKCYFGFPDGVVKERL